jgi:hypothetical protein
LLLVFDTSDSSLVDFRHPRQRMYVFERPQAITAFNSRVPVASSSTLCVQSFVPFGETVRPLLGRHRPMIKHISGIL